MRHPKKKGVLRRAYHKQAGAYDQLRPETTIKANSAFIPEDLLDAVQAVLVQKLSDNGAALVLHSKSRKVNRLRLEDSISAYRV